MASVVSQPLQIVTGLRNVEYKFTMASIGVPPEEKRLIYRLRNVTDGTYLTNWKEYPTVEDGQIIPIDFTEDLRGILSTPAPNLSLVVNAVNTTILKTIEVEYGERTVNTETCETTDTPEGTTNQSDVLNGIRRHRSLGSLIGLVLGNRAKRYSVQPDSADFLYVAGSMSVRLSYYTAANTFISQVTHTITNPFPGSSVTIIPIGFNIAPSGAAIMHVSATTTGTASFPTDLLFTVDTNFWAKEQSAIVDFYFQNNMGGVDLLSFEAIDAMAMSVQKQEIVSRFEGVVYSQGQRHSINNTSFPTLYFKRTWNKPLKQDDQFWLNELAASNNVWAKLYLPNGFPILVKMVITTGDVSTRGTPHEFIIGAYFSEVFLFPH